MISGFYVVVRITLTVEPLGPHDYILVKLNLRHCHVIDFEISDSLRVTLIHSQAPLIYN